MAMYKLSELSLYPASPEQVLESRKRTFRQWGSGSTLEQYLLRDARTDQHQVSLGRRLTTWILKPRDSSDAFDFLCSCETYRRDGLVCGGNNIEEEPRVVSSYGIASVYTPPQNRGKGYAKYMMRLLHWVLAPDVSLPRQFPAEWGQPPERRDWVGNAAFSALYSDVGPTFYAICGMSPEEPGWVVREPYSTTWDVAQAKDLIGHRINQSSQPKQEWEWLDADGVSAIWMDDADKIQHELMSSSAQTVTKATFLPINGVAEFQYHRLRQFWKNITPVPTHWGIAGSSETVDSSLFATWTIDCRPALNCKKLIVTRIRATPGQFDALLEKIVQFASAHSLETVEMWNLPPDLSASAEATGGNTFAREDHLPSFKWYGNQDNGQKVEWLHNEKFCWC